MFKRESATKIIIFTVLIVISIVFISPKMTAQKEDDFTDIQIHLKNISDDQGEILNYLFAQSQEIAALENEKDKIMSDIHDTKRIIDNLDKLIKKETDKYEDRLDVLKQVLKSYQRMGATSFIEIILDADSVSSLIRRINTIRDLTKSAGKLLDSINKSKEQLLTDKSNLDEKLDYLETKEKNLENTIKEKDQRTKEMEQYLASLKGDKVYYEEQLDNIIKMMEKTTEFIGKISNKFSHIVREGNIPDDKVVIKFTAKGIKCVMHEELFNEIIENNPDLPEIILKFTSDKVEMEFPTENLLFIGYFDIVGKQTLKLQVIEGDFYGFNLSKNSIDDFLKEGDFILDFKPLLGKNTIEQIEINEGYIELTMGIRLF